MEIIGAELTPQEASYFTEKMYVDLQLHHPALVGVTNWVRFDLVPTIMKARNRSVYDVSMNVGITLPDGTQWTIAETKSVDAELYEGAQSADVLFKAFTVCVDEVITDIKPKLVLMADSFTVKWLDISAWADRAIDRLPMVDPPDPQLSWQSDFGTINIFETHAYRNRSRR